MRLGVNKARQKIEEVIEVQLRGESVYISAGEDIWIKGGAQIIAKGDIELIAGNDIHMEPGKALMEFASSGYGVTGGMGSGLAPSVGFDFQKAHGYELHAKHNHLKAGERVIMRSKGGQYLVGTIVEAKDIEVKANKLLIESVYDRHEQFSKGLSADTSLAFGVNAGDADSQWIKKPSGFYATNRLNVAIDEDLELIGSVLIGPDGDTHIQSERFCYRHLAESESSSSFNVAASFIWDAGSIDFGSVIPGSFEFNYHTASQSGTTHATVAGSRYEEQSVNGVLQTVLVDALDIKDLEHSDDFSGLNRDPNTTQTRSAKHSSHVRLNIPIADIQKIWENLRSAKTEVFDKQIDDLFSDSTIPSSSQTENEIKEQHLDGHLDSHADLAIIDDASNVQESEITIESETNHFLIETFGVDWKGVSATIQDEVGIDYLAYKGSWLNENGEIVEGKGVIRLIDLPFFNYLKSFDQGTAVIEFNSENKSLFFDINTEGNRFQWVQSMDSFIKEAILKVDFSFANKPNVKIVNIHMKTFIAARVLELLVPAEKYGVPGAGRWAGDNHDFEEISDNNRTSQNIKIIFENSQATVIDEWHATGITYKLDEIGNIIAIGQASGDSLKYTFEKEFSRNLQRYVYHLYMKSNEGNPLVWIAPEINYEISMFFELDGTYIEGDIEHDKFPSYQLYFNEKTIYEFSEKGHTPFDLFSIMPNQKSKIISE